MSANTPTNTLTQNCIKILKARGCVAWRNNTGGMPIEYKGKKRFLRFGQKGSGDILAIIPPLGQFASIEVKTGDDELRDSQEDWIEEIENVGGLTCVVRSLDDIVSFIDDAMGKPKAKAYKKQRCVLVTSGKTRKYIPADDGDIEIEQVA